MPIKRFRLYYIDETESTPPHYIFGRGPEFNVSDDGQGYVPDGSGHGTTDPVMMTPPPPYFDTWSAYLAVCTGLRFEIDHFSRWKTVAGGTDGKDGWPWDQVHGGCEPSLQETQPPSNPLQ